MKKAIAVVFAAVTLAAAAWTAQAPAAGHGDIEVIAGHGDIEVLGGRG
jgi:hypothetical protein